MRLTRIPVGLRHMKLTLDETVLTRELMTYALYPDQVAMMIVVCRVTGVEPFEMLQKFVDVRDEVWNIANGLYSTGIWEPKGQDSGGGGSASQPGGKGR